MTIGLLILKAHKRKYEIYFIGKFHGNQYIALETLYF